MTKTFKTSYTTLLIIIIIITFSITVYSFFKHNSFLYSNIEEMKKSELRIGDIVNIKGYLSSDIEYKSGLQVDKNDHICTDTYLYMICNDGALGEK